MEKLKKRLEAPGGLDFFGSSKSSAGGKMSRMDFSATKTQMAKEGKKPRISLVFRNGVEKVLAPSGKIEFAIKGSRLYFRDGADRGYFITSKKNKSENGYAQIHAEPLYDFLKEYGDIDRNIKADNELGYYYVDAEDMDWMDGREA